VFVDSSHEEQAWRLHELDPQGPDLDDVTAQLGYYVKPGERLFNFLVYAVDLYGIHCRHDH
jgi:hypothetical protein